MIGSGGIPEELTDSWLAFVDDLEATAEEYREQGYEVVEIHAGDVVPLADRVALDVLAPGSEFAALQKLVDEFDPDEFTVYKAEQGETTFAVIVAEDSDRRAVVCTSVFFHYSVARQFLENATEAGFFQVQIRPLSDDEHVVFRIDEPELLVD